MSTLHRDSGQGDSGHRETTQQDALGVIVFTKGAPDVLLTRCSRELVDSERRLLTPERRAEILQVNDALASEALKTLGVASRSLSRDERQDANVERQGANVERDLVFAGLIGMIDPPRAEARAAVARARGAGIGPLMITGDHPRTAAVVARELGITEDGQDGRVITGAEFEAMSDDARTDTVARVSVYARVNPEHKLRIVDALRRTGAVVAMTGDGVNDTPALKKADIGVAMGVTGTDVSKRKRPTWCSPTTISRRLWRRSKRAARSSRISGSSCATCCRRISAKC